MTYANTTLLGLNQPTTGSESGVWGDDVNNGFTQLVDLAVAGTNNITQDSDITLAISNGSNSSSFTSTATNSTVAQYAILNCTGSRTAARNIIVPASSKLYVIYNNTSGGFAITVKKSAGTGVAIANGEKALIYYDNVTATDVVKIVSTTTLGTVTTGTWNASVIGAAYGGTGVANNAANTITFTGNYSLGLTLTANTTATFPTSGYHIATVTNMANNPVTGTPSSSTYLRGDGTWATISATTPGGSNTYVQYNSSGSFAGSANHTFDGTTLTLGNAGVSARFQGDFSNATFSTRTAFQTGTANSTTGIYALPNGTSTAASWQATNNSDPTNASKILIATNGSTDVQLVSGINGTGTYLPLTFYTNGAEKMRLDTSGNLGLGVTPSAWGGSYKVEQIGAQGVAFYSGGTFGLANNFYNNGSGNFRIAADYATLYQQSVGQHQWLIAGTSTAGSSVSFTQAMTLSNAGGLSVGTTADPGAGAIYATGNITAYYSSDIKFKTNVQDIQDPLGIVTAIGSKTFDWTDEYLADHGGEDEYFQPKQSFGVIAQDVQKVFPQAVRTRTDGSLAVDYEKLAILSFGAIGQLLKRVEALENK